LSAPRTIKSADGCRTEIAGKRAFEAIVWITVVARSVSPAGGSGGGLT
jgi:hypothetical protein